MKKTIFNFIRNNYLIITILIVGIALRFYNIFNLHLVNDELSALSRTLYNNLNNLINNGVMQLDTHPALIQIFLYFYTKLFGFNDFVVKLPFLIFGVFSIYLSYKIAVQFFSKTSGYITASYIAVLQYTIMYSQIARPYSSGLFIVLAFTYYIQDFIFKNEVSKKSIFLLIFFGTLGAYNHYFSSLTIILISSYAIFLIKKENLKKYFLSLSAIALLFTPHIKITLHQISLGGLSWLGKPDFNFIKNYLGYIFNYCWLLAIFAVGIIVLGFIFINRKEKIKYSIFTLFIFLMPFFIGYYYSIKMSPVLQFSALLFSFPFLLMFLSSFIKELTKKLNFLIVTFILTFGTISLIFIRKHYVITYKTPFYEVASNLKADLNKFGIENISESFVLNGNFYINKYLVDFNIDTTKLKSNYQKINVDIKNFKNFVYNSKTEYFAFGSLLSLSDIYLTNIIKEKYPYLVNCSDNYFLFSKNNHKPSVKTTIIDTVFYNKLDFSTQNNIWNYNNNNILLDTIYHKKYFHFKNSDEYGPTITINLDSILSHKNNIIIVKAKVKSNTNNSKLAIVSDVFNSDSSLHWSDANISNFTDETSSISHFYKIIFLQDIKRTKKTFNKIYLWNNNKNEFDVFEIEIIVLNGKLNPYGILEPLN